MSQSSQISQSGGGGLLYIPRGRKRVRRAERRERSGTSFLYRQADACRSPIVSLMTARSRKQKSSSGENPTSFYCWFALPEIDNALRGRPESGGEIVRGVCIECRSEFLLFLVLLTFSVFFLNLLLKPFSLGDFFLFFLVSLACDVTQNGQ